MATSSADLRGMKFNLAVEAGKQTDLAAELQERAGLWPQVKVCTAKLGEGRPENGTEEKSACKQVHLLILTPTGGLPLL